MKSGGPILLGIAGGYLLGRSRKMKLVLLIGGLLARKRLSGLTTDVLASSPELNRLADSVRGQLVEAGRSAAIAAASHRMDSFSDMLHERAEGLRTPPGPAAPETTPEPGEEAPDEEAPAEEPPAEEPADEEAPAEEEPRREPAATGAARSQRRRPEEREEGRERTAARTRGSGTRQRPPPERRGQRAGRPQTRGRRETGADGS